MIFLIKKGVKWWNKGSKSWHCLLFFRDLFCHFFHLTVFYHHSALFYQKISPCFHKDFPFSPAALHAWHCGHELHCWLWTRSLVYSSIRIVHVESHHCLLLLPTCVRVHRNPCSLCRECQCRFVCNTRTQLLVMVGWSCNVCVNVCGGRGEGAEEERRWCGVVWCGVLFVCGVWCVWYVWCDVSASDCVCACVRVCQHFDDTVFLPLAHFSSFATCMRCGLDVCPLIGATATSTNEALPCNGRDCLLPRNLHIKNDRFSIADLVFSLWSRKKAMTHFTKTPCLVSSLVDETFYEKKKMDQWEKCPPIAHKLFWHVCMWLVLVDLMFYGLWTNWHEQWQNGREHVTNAWLVWFLTFITRVITGNFVMWEIQQKTADWDYSKPQTLLGTLKTQIDFGLNSVYLWKSNIRSHKLDV